VYGLISKEKSYSIAKRMRIFLKKQEIEGNVIVAAGSNQGAAVEVLDAESFVNSAGIQDREPANYGQAWL